MSEALWRSSRAAWAMAFGFFLLILAVSSIPAEAMPNSPTLWRWDKLIHAAEYAVAATLLYRAMSLAPPALRRLAPAFRFLICLLFCASFGVFDELYQGTVSGRHSSPYDMLADMAGASFACVANAVFYSRQLTAHRI
jgi:VanZ family protein